MADARRPSGPRPGTAERRARILDAALRTFGAKGSTKGSLGDVAEQVGMTHAGVLHHFGSKDALLLEVLRHRDERDLTGVEGRLPEGVDLFRHLVRTAAVNERRPGIVQGYVVLSAESVTEDHPGRDFFVARYRSLRDEIVRALETLCAERGRPADDVARASAAIVAVMDGLQVQWLLDPDGVDLAGTTAAAVGAIVAAVLDPRPSPLGPPEDWPPSTVTGPDGPDAA